MNTGNGNDLSATNGTTVTQSSFLETMQQQCSCKPVLVAGSDGLIGRHLCQFLTELGAELTVLTRHADSPTAGLADRTVIGDFSDPAVVAESIRGQQVVFDCVGAFSAVSSMNNATETYRNECLVHIAFFEACASIESSPVVVFPSSRLVYGVPQSLPVAENHPAAPMSHYAISKVTVERFLEISSKERGLRSRVFRLTNPYATRNAIDNCSYNVITRFASKISQGERVELYGDGSQLRDYIAIQDVCNAFVAAGFDESDTADIFNLGGPRAISIRESVELMVDAADGVAPKFVPWPENDKQVETGDYWSDNSKLFERYPLPPFMEPADGLRALIRELEPKTKELESCVGK